MSAVANTDTLSLDRSSSVGKSIFMVGIKGAGMTALAELLTHLGAQVSGSDTDEVFYTDEILARLGLQVIPSFDQQWLPNNAALVIYSAAYSPEHPQLMAARRRGVRCISYPEAIGELSSSCFAVAIAGVHGKTTTTAMLGALLRALDVPGAVLVGGAVLNFDGMSCWMGGTGMLVAETCEYRRHFLSYCPDVVVITAIEADHLDYYADVGAMEDAFVEFALRLPAAGRLLYCADNPAATRVATRVATRRADIESIPFGRQAQGVYALQDVAEQQGAFQFRLANGPRVWQIPLPGRYNVLNATAALAALDASAAQYGVHIFGNAAADTVAAQKTWQALATFAGVQRRCEVVGTANEIMILDDYAHHPTAIRATLSGLRSFYRPQRLIVDFMSHTYSRTAALLQEFAGAFAHADIVYLHAIYASAREHHDGTVTGASLAATIAAQHPDVRYFANLLDALPDCLAVLRAGDLFITMGAGDNWRLGRQLLEQLRKRA